MEPLPPHPATAAMGLVASFALGAIPFGVIWSLAIAGIDPRKAGSKNIGFTNVLRVSSRWAAGLTLTSDVGKGAAAVWIVRHLNGGADPAWDCAAVLSAVSGHMFSPILRFQGGKGVATALGGLFIAMPWVGLIILGVWSVVLTVSSYVSLASIVASLVLPVTMALFTSNWIAIACGTMLTVLVIVRHSENIKRLQAGEEHSIRGSKPTKTV